MAAKKSVLVGIAAIAVIGVVAVVYFSQWPPSDEDVTGAIGAAERYRAEQITDEDVILDFPGQDELAEAVFDVLSDEQKAELLGRTVESERGVNFKRFEANEAAFERWSANQKAGFVNALNRDAQADLAAAMKIDASDFAAMRSEMVAEKFSGLDQEARSRAFNRFEANEAAFARWSVNQKAGFTNVLGAQTFERAILQARTFNRLTHAQQRQVWSRLGSDGQFAALRYAGVDANLARGDALQRGDQFERVMQERRANK